MDSLKYFEAILIFGSTEVSRDKKHTGRIRKGHIAATRCYARDNDGVDVPVQISILVDVREVWKPPLKVKEPQQ